MALKMKLKTSRIWQKGKNKLEIRKMKTKVKKISK